MLELVVSNSKHFNQLFAVPFQINLHLIYILKAFCCYLWKNMDPNLYCTDLDHLRLSDSTAASDGCTVSRDIASHFWFVLAFFILHIKCIGAGEGREGGGKSSRPMICSINSVLNHLGCLNFSLRKVRKILYVNKCYGCLTLKRRLGTWALKWFSWVSFFFCNFLSSYVSSTKSPKI